MKPACKNFRKEYEHETGSIRPLKIKLWTYENKIYTLYSDKYYSFQRV